MFVVLLCIAATLNIVMMNRWPMVTAEYWSPSDGTAGSVSSTTHLQQQQQQHQLYALAELQQHRQRHHRHQQPQNDFGPATLADGVDNEDTATSRPNKSKKPHKKNLIRKGQRLKNNKNGNLHFHNNMYNFLISKSFLILFILRRRFYSLIRLGSVILNNSFVFICVSRR